jgi:hypothetical protein
MGGGAMSRLIDVEAKIERAKKHVDDLHSDITAFLAEQAGTISSDLDPDSGDRIYRLHNVPELPAGWTDVIADAAHNLRSALNYLICRLVEANGGTDISRVQFPICESATAYGKTETERLVKGISPAAKGVLDGIKPYAGGNDVLWALSVINNQDKHRFRLCAFPAWNRMVVRKPAGAGFFTHNVMDRLSPLVNGTEIGRIRAPHGVTEHANLQLSFDVAFAEPEVVMGQAVFPLLDELVAAVRDVVDRFRPLLI